jgi:hypothetical protein
VQIPGDPVPVLEDREALHIPAMLCPAQWPQDVSQGKWLGDGAGGLAGEYPFLVEGPVQEGRTPLHGEGTSSDARDARL